MLTSIIKCGTKKFWLVSDHWRMRWWRQKSVELKTLFILSVTSLSTSSSCNTLASHRCNQVWMECFAIPRVEPIPKLPRVRRASVLLQKTPKLISTMFVIPANVKKGFHQWVRLNITCDFFIWYGVGSISRWYWCSTRCRPTCYATTNGHTQFWHWFHEIWKGFELLHNQCESDWVCA